MSTNPKLNTCPLCNCDVHVEGNSLFGEQACAGCGKKLWFLTAAHEARFFDYETSGELRDKACGFIAERFEIDREKLTPNVLDEMDVDSLEALEMLMELEEELGLV